MGSPYQPGDIRPAHQLALSIAHAFGWCMQSEVLTLERRQLDLGLRTLRLESGTTKSDDGRVVYLTAELKASIMAQLERVKALERETEGISPYLFPHLRGPHQGKRIQDFKRTWKTACAKAGCPECYGRTFEGPQCGRWSIWVYLKGWR